MFSTDQRDDVIVLTATVQEMDARNAQGAKEMFRELVENGSRKIVVDLSSLSFVDSSGLGALVSVLKTARAVNGEVRLCGLSPEVRSIFQLTRLFKVFDIHEDIDAAIDSFQ